MDGESNQAWAALVCYCELGPGRTFPACADALGHPESYIRQLKRWHKKWSWRERASQWDTAELAIGMQNRAEAREQARQVAYDHAVEAIVFMVKVMRGEVDLKEVDDKGKPLIRVSTRFEASKHIAGLAQIVMVSRGDVVHRSQSRAEEAAQKFEGHSIEQLAALVSAAATTEH